MKTSALITLTQRKVHGYTRIQLAEFYDEIQKMVFAKPLELMHYIDSTTGREPLLSTYNTDYSLSGANLLNTITVSQSIDTNTPATGSIIVCNASGVETTYAYSSYTGSDFTCVVAADTYTGTNETLRLINGREYELTTATVGADIQSVYNVYPEDALNSHSYYGMDLVDEQVYGYTKQGTGENGSPSTFIFSNNPGKANYYVTCYRYPTPITSELIQLEIPEKFHISHVLLGVIGLIEVFEHGQSKTYNDFIEKSIPKIQGYLSSEGSTTVRHTNGGGF
jgi:hypothetical protein